MAKTVRLPGLIDIHVHLRDPGETSKEDFYTGTRAALAGGVTTIFDMPNNIEPIFSLVKLAEKMEVVRKKTVCDFGLYFGSVGDNTHEFRKVADMVIGLKLYLSMTTGKYVIGDEDLLDNIFQKWPKEKIIVVHAEGDRVDLAIKMAINHQSRMHITHVSTKDSLEKIIEAKKRTNKITCDTAPHYLLLNAENLDKLRGFGIVKPPLATRKDQEYLRKNLDKIDCIASDHAPHTMAEKCSPVPPAGIPGVETMLPLLLELVSTDEIIRLTNTNPSRIFGIKQEKDSYVVIDKGERYKIDNSSLFTKCGWSPFNDWEVQGNVKEVYVRGTKVFEDGKVFVSPGFGRQMYVK